MLQPITDESYLWLGDTKCLQWKTQCFYPDERVTLLYNCDRDCILEFYMDSPDELHVCDDDYSLAP